MNMELLAGAVAVVAAFLIIVAWRSKGRYGKLRPSKEAAAAYESFSVDPDRHYYSSGPGEYPSAIIGITKSRTLKTDLWRRRELDTTGMKGLVQNMQRRARERGRMLHGFDILDRHGEIIGDGYSGLDKRVTVKTDGDGTVVISTPPMETDLP
jgi:hypothetical protein